jgi:ABC-type bacteriocin/lantibiotic exporter with double-glycine peptidase domain
MNPALLGWILLFVIPHVLFNQLFIARAMPRFSKAVLEATGRNTGEMSAIITSADVAALYDAQGFFLKRFEDSSRNLFAAKMRIHTRKAIGEGIVPLFGLGGYLALLIVCSGWIADGQLSFGDLTAAFQYRGGVLVGSFMLINCMINIQASMAGIRRINETLYTETEE